jgi:hypothetical protein
VRIQGGEHAERRFSAFAAQQEATLSGTVTDSTGGGLSAATAATGLRFTF